MLPLKLSIEGLYSYQEKQTIDFQELTQAGLFGIFGAVGSGKSSVLEAIGFVLYGDTERLNKSDKRSYNMLNLKSNETNIEFEFLNFEERKFKFVANWKRKKKFEDTTPIERLAYEWIDEKWLPIASADATELIGLTYENFRRTIIIPQGKFKEFLDLKGKDRSDMMKEIFHLQKFDLSAKVGALQSATKTQFDQLKGALTGYDSISQESVLLKAEEKKVAQEVLDKYRAEFALIEKELQILKTLKTNFEDLETKKSNLLILEKQKPQMDALQAEIDEFEKAERIFGKELSNLKQTSDALKMISWQFNQTKEAFEITDKNLKNNEEALALLQVQYNTSEQNKNKVADLESIAKILNYKSNISSFESKLEEDTKLFLTAENKEKEIKSQLSNLQNSIKELKLKRMDTNVLIDLGNWYNNQQNYLNNLALNKSQIQQTQDDIIKSKQLIEELSLPLVNWREHIQDKLDTLEKQKSELVDIKSKLLVAKELSQYVDNLHEGENCPLCGSTEHPNIMHTEDVSENLNANETALSQINADINGMHQTNLKAEKNQLSINQSEKQLQQFLNDKETLEKAIENHLNQFIWKEFDANDTSVFKTKRKEQQQLEGDIKDTEDKALIFDKELEKVVNSLKQIIANKNKIENDKATFEGALNNELSQLKILAFEDYKNTNVEVIQNEKTALETEIARIEKEYKSKSDLVQTEKEKIATLKGKLDSEKVQLENNQKNLQKIQEAITDLLKTHQYESIENVTLILSKIWEIEVEKEKTKQFVIAIQTAQNAVNESQKLTQGQIFDTEIFKKKDDQFNESVQTLENQVGLVSTLDNELKNIQESLKAKEILLTQYTVLESRSVNLGTLANMFSGSGFVNYVSSIYLQNLCDVANVRFHRMTKNQLSLKINNSNEFEVVDYLNNGASRSVKTLSGGQGFQASLCLALALAESVQSLNKNDKNFFFIDEGFGTQDQESVAIVFETLQSLYKENRIVGIISHVAELQEQIPRSINIVKDEEKGSMIYETWN
jgi:exonuclease SbcC